MLSHDKQLRTLSQHLGKNMRDGFVKSPLTPLCQRGEKRERIFAKEGGKKGRIFAKEGNRKDKNDPLTCAMGGYRLMESQKVWKPEGKRSDVSNEQKRNDKS